MYLMNSSVYKTDRNKVTEQDLGVLKSCHQQLVERIFQHFLVDLVLVQKHISIYLNLDSED